MKLTDLAPDPLDGWLAGLAAVVSSDRLNLDCVRAVGDRHGLQLFASDGHVLAVVTVTGDFRGVDLALDGASVRTIGHLRHSVWGVELDFVDCVWRAPRTGELSAEKYLKVVPPSRSPAAIGGWFLGPALSAGAEVVRRFGAQVSLSGALGEKEPLRLDSAPRAVEGLDGEAWWLTVVVMPGNHT